MPVPEPAFYVDSGGALRPIPADQAADAEALGWTPASADQIKAHLTQAKYGDAIGAVGAGSAAFLRALTLGGSDVALPAITGALGGDPEAAKEALRGAAEANPLADTAGTVAGIAAPLLLTGGAAAPAEGAVQGAARATAPALVARAGQAVTRGVEAALPEAEGLLGRVVSKAVATGAGSAIEGAAYGAGQVVSEAALGDPNLTAQSALATIGLSAALGGGLGGALGIVGEVAPAAFKRASEGITSAVQKAKEAYPELAERLTGGEVTADQVRTAMAKYGAAFKDPREVARLQKDLGGALEDAANGVERAKRTMYAEARPLETADLLAGQDPAALAQRAGAAREKMIATLTEAAETARADPDLVTGRVVGEVEKIRDGFLRRTEGAAPLEVFENLRTARQQLDGLAEWSKVNRDLPPLAQRNAVQVARGLRGAVKDAITDEATWGPAAARHAALDDLNSAYQRAFKTLTSGKLGPLNSNILPKVTREGQEAFQLNPRALKTALNQMGDPRGERVAEAVFGYLDAAQNYVKGMEETYQHLPSSTFDRGALEDLIGTARDLTGKAQIQAEATRFLNDLNPNAGLGAGGAKALLPQASNAGAASGLGTVAMAPIVGHMIPGAGPVMAAYGALKAGYHIAEGLKNIPQTVATLTRLERMSQRVTAAIDTGASTLVRAGARAESVGRAEVAAGISKEFAAGPEDALKRHARRVSEVQKLADPESMQKAILSQNEGLDEHAPNTAQALAVASARGVAFLNSKLPQHPQRGPLAPKWEPSQGEVAKFARYYEAVQDPLIVLKQAAAGTLTPEAVEAVQAVYPDLMAKIRASLVEKMAGAGAVPARSRMALSLVIGEDLDGRLGMLPAMQAAWQSRTQQKQQQNSAIKPSSSGIGRISLSNRSLTPMQASASRRGG